MKPRGGPPLWLMNSRGGPPFLGCMLMDSRGGPPILRGGPPLGTISMDHTVLVHCAEAIGLIIDEFSIIFITPVKLFANLSCTLAANTVALRCKNVSYAP